MAAYLLNRAQRPAVHRIVDSIGAQLQLNESCLFKTMTNAEKITQTVIDFCYDDYHVTEELGHITTLYRFLEFINEFETDWD